MFVDSHCHPGRAVRDGVGGSRQRYPRQLFSLDPGGDTGGPRKFPGFSAEAAEDLLIPITETISLDESELEERYIRSPGPGGQKVNKVATAVQLRFDVARSGSLPHQVKQRLLRLGGRRVSGEGVLYIQAHRFRARERNRRDALERLVELIRKASCQPKPRKKTKPTRASKERRLESKRRRAQTKRTRGSPGWDG